MKHSKTIKLTLSAMFLALGFVLPFFTGQIPQIGNMLLPMHLPVLLCGLICGWQYGLVFLFFTLSLPLRVGRKNAIFSDIISCFFKCNN